MKIRLIALLATLPLLSPLARRIRRRHRGRRSLQQDHATTETSDPGATYFFAPIINDWATYDTSTQNLVMSAKVDEGDRKEKDDLRFKTRDGNDIETDVTVRWRIDPTQAGDIWRTVAPNTVALKERLVRPLARAYVRDVLNRLDSEEYYNPDLRFAAASDATKVWPRN